MVAQITEGTALDKHGRPFRRRSYRPGIIAVGVMFVITAIVWAFALTRPVDVREVAACNPPPTNANANANANAPKLGDPVSHASMIDVAPAKLTQSKINVLNASGQGGQAGEVAGALRDLGFAQPTAANDPIYVNTRLICHGQIRFGPSGRAGAAAVWLVAPCVELFQDSRPDDSVDLAIGTEFTTLAHSDDIDAVLAGLRPDATEPADSTLIAKIHNGTC